MDTAIMGLGFFPRISVRVYKEISKGILESTCKGRAAVLVPSRAGFRI